MKKVFVMTFILLFITCLALAGSAQAATISFGDTGPYYWPGYPSSSSTINNTEHWGIPNITDGTATFTGSSLTGVTINMTKILPRYDWLYEGDLFIDLGGDKTWDYIVSNYASSYQITGDPDDQGATWKLYQVTPTVNLSDSWFYIYSHNFDGSGTIRDNHPIEVDPL
ncbi:MAG: hypothetical protein JRI54_08065, partial [Deltaproteobacteria bacterium]|nr:hypothetical protein [Deltaproteobacteria bacterium]